MSYEDPQSNSLCKPHFLKVSVVLTCHRFFYLCLMCVSWFKTRSSSWLPCYGQDPPRSQLQGWEGSREVQLLPHNVWRLCLWVKATYSETISLVINVICCFPPSLLFTKSPYREKKGFLTDSQEKLKHPRISFADALIAENFCNQFHLSQAVSQVCLQLSEKITTKTERK